MCYEFRSGCSVIKHPNNRSLIAASESANGAAAVQTKLMVQRNTASKLLKFS